MTDLMENRKLMGRSAIQKKLKHKQEFQMGSTLSGNAPIWTQWHQNRAMEQEIDKDLSAAPNKKYIAVSLPPVHHFILSLCFNEHGFVQIVKQIVKPQFTAKLCDWAVRITDQHKKVREGFQSKLKLDSKFADNGELLCSLKGLHVIKFIVDMRGMKRFKKNPAADAMSSTEIMSDVKNMPNAKSVFRKMTNTTQYAQQFGARPKELKDYKVLDKKPLGKLSISQVLKPEITQMLSRWLAIND